MESSRNLYTLGWKWKAPPALENNYNVEFCNIIEFSTNIHISRYIYSIPDRNTCWCVIGYAKECL